MDDERYLQILDQFRNGCVFCDPDPDLVALSTEQFQVTFDAAPLTPGHLIIHSRQHYSCAGELSETELDSVRRLVDEVKEVVRREYGTFTLYEHGRAGHCLSDGPEHRLCHHFHLHCVPGDYRLAEVLGERFERLSVPDYGKMGQLYEEYGDYLYLENDDAQASYFIVSEAIERHLMRTLIAGAIGRPERANWRTYQDGSMLRAGIMALRPRLDVLRLPVASRCEC